MELWDSSKTNKKVIEIISDDIKLSYSLLKAEPHIDVQIFGDRINVMVDEPERELKKIESILTDKNISITSDRVVTPSLENIVIHLVKEAG